MPKFTYGDKTYTAQPAKHFRLPDGTILRSVSTVDGVAFVEPAKKPNSVTEYENAVEVTDSAKDSETTAADKSEQPLDPKLALRQRIDALKATREDYTKRMADLSDTRDEVDAQIAAALLDYDKGRSRDTPPTPIVLGGKRYRAQRARNGGAPSLVLVPEVGESL